MLYSSSVGGVGAMSVCWWGELAWGEQAGVGDVVVVAQVAGRVDVEGLAGAGGVAGGVERGGQFGVVEAGADAAGQLDRGRVGVAELDGVLAPGGLQLLGGA